MGRTKRRKRREKNRKGKKREPKKTVGKKDTCVLNMWREKTIRSACFIFVCSSYYITQERFNKAYK